MTALEKKEELLNGMQQSIEESLVNCLITTRMTSSCAPAYGWSVEEYMYMPIVADRLRAKGYSVRSAVNHGVTDWHIAV